MSLYLYWGICKAEFKHFNVSRSVQLIWRMYASLAKEKRWVEILDSVLSESYILWHFMYVKLLGAFFVLSCPHWPAHMEMRSDLWRAAAVLCFLCLSCRSSVKCPTAILDASDACCRNWHQHFLLCRSYCLPAKSTLGNHSLIQSHRARRVGWATWLLLGAAERHSPPLQLLILFGSRNICLWPLTSFYRHKP